jgi:hypothetical protein
MSKEFFISNGFITLHDGSKIIDVPEGVACSHNNFKMMCVRCGKHLMKDHKLFEAFYDLNKNYLLGTKVKEA